MMTIRLLVVLTLIATPFLFGQDSSPVETKFKVYGNCGMCKKRIEKAVSIKEVKFSRWDKSTKMLTVAYLPEAVSLDSLQRRIAAVGHDTDRFKAADSVYAALPACCLYREGDRTH